MYDMARERAFDRRMEWPSFDEFWKRGYLEIPEASKPHVIFEDSGSIQRVIRFLPHRDDRIFSEKSRAFNYRIAPVKS